MSAGYRERLDFARRPFLDERPVWAVVTVALLAGALLLVANFRLYAAFRRDVAHVLAEIEQLHVRGAAAAKASSEARAVLQSYKLSSLAAESESLLRLVAERRFSWTGLLARLERTVPADVRLARLTPHFDSVEEVGLDIGLVGRSPDSVVKTIAALSADPTFHDVELKTEASPERGAPEGYSFELAVIFKPEAPR